MKRNHIFLQIERESLPMWSLLLLCHYFPGKYSDEIPFLCPPVQLFTAITYHTTSTEWNHPNFLHIPNVRKKFHSDIFSPRTTLWSMDSLLNTIILTSLTQGVVVIYSPHPHNLHFQLPPLSSISHFIRQSCFSSNPLTCVAFKSYIGWIWLSKLYRNKLFVIVFWTTTYTRVN